MNLTWTWVWGYNMYSSVLSFHKASRIEIMYAVFEILFVRRVSQIEIGEKETQKGCESLNTDTHVRKKEQESRVAD